MITPSRAFHRSQGRTERSSLQPVLVSLIIGALLIQAFMAAGMQPAPARYAVVELCAWHGGIQQVRVLLPADPAGTESGRLPGVTDHIDCLVCLTGQTMAVDSTRTLPLDPHTALWRAAGQIRPSQQLPIANYFSRAPPAVPV